MPDIRTRSAANPEFARVVETARLRGLPEFAFDIAPDAAEAAALARLLDAQAVKKLRFKGRLAPAPDGAWRLEAALGATVTQTCVVSLEPVVARVDAPVRRLFAPGAAAPTAEVVVGVEDDETEPLGPEIDLGLVATEALALALPAYPRRSDARLEIAASAPPGAAPLPEPEVRPFGALAALRARMAEDP